MIPSALHWHTFFFTIAHLVCSLKLPSLMKYGYICKHYLPIVTSFSALLDSVTSICHRASPARHIIHMSIIVIKMWHVSRTPVFRVPPSLHSHSGNKPIISSCFHDGWITHNCFCTVIDFCLNRDLCLFSMQASGSQVSPSRRRQQPLKRSKPRPQAVVRPGNMESLYVLNPISNIMLDCSCITVCQHS